MPCQKHNELLERWWNDRLTESERSDLEQRLMTCADCRQELEGSRELWDLMGLMPVPEPSEEMQTEFNAMLEGFKASEEGKQRTTPGAIADLRQLFRFRPWVAAAFTGLLILSGMGLEWWIGRSQRSDSSVATGSVTPSVTPTTSPVPPSRDTTAGSVAQTADNTAGPVKPTAKPESGSSEESRQLETLTAQVREMRGMMMLSLLQNPAASERIKAVSYTSDISRVDPKIAVALLATLNNDPNVNVRLTTLEALTHFSGDPLIREGLVQSIIRQESPLVQAALADVMLRLQEKRAILPFKKLLEQKDLNDRVRTRIQKTLVGLT